MAVDEGVVDLEEFAKKGEAPPAGAKYQIRIDKEKRIVSVDRLTGREILKLVEKTPEQFKLFLHVKGAQPRDIGADEPVVFTTKGIERFSTLARDSTEGC
jgi:hypothetical protein